MLSINQRNVSSLSVLSCFSGCCTRPVMEMVVVCKEKKGAAQKMEVIRVRPREGAGGHGGTSRSKRGRRRRGMGEGDGWLMKKETGGVSERPEKVSG